MELDRGRIFQSPDSAPIHEVEFEPAFLPREQILLFSEGQVRDYIHNTLIYHEDKKYGGPEFNDAESKLGFLDGGREGDVSTASRSDGTYIMKNRVDYYQSGEIAEVAEAVTSFNKRGQTKELKARAMGEMGDIFWNLEALVVKDPDFKADYQQAMQVLARSLGISMRECLLLAALKYNDRLQHGKRPEEEDQDVLELITKKGKKSAISEPSNQSLSTFTRNLNKIERQIIIPRHKMFFAKYDMEKQIYGADDRD